MMNSKCTKNWRSFVHIFFLFHDQSVNQLQPTSRSSSISLHFLYKHITTTIFCSASFFKSLIRHVGGLKIGSGHNSIILQESIRHVGGLKIGSGHNSISSRSISAKNTWVPLITTVEQHWSSANFCSFCLTPIKLVILYIKKNSFRNMIDHELNLVSSNKACNWSFYITEVVQNTQTSIK